MARLHIDLPEHFLFTTEIPVRASDVNYGGHVGNDAILTLMQEARIQLYRSLGYASEISFEGTVGQIITDASVTYKSESFLGDVLIIRLAVTGFSRCGFEMFYQLVNKATGKDVALGKTGIVCFDYATRKVASIPESLRAQLQSDL